MLYIFYIFAQLVAQQTIYLKPLFSRILYKGEPAIAINIVKANTFHNRVTVIPTVGEVRNQIVRARGSLAMLGAFKDVYPESIELLQFNRKELLRAEKKAGKSLTELTDNIKRVKRVVCVWMQGHNESGSDYYTVLNVSYATLKLNLGAIDIGYRGYEQMHKKQLERLLKCAYLLEE